MFIYKSNSYTNRVRFGAYQSERVPFVSNSYDFGRIFTCMDFAEAGKIDSIDCILF